jgi:hypothetical protein
LVFFPLNHSLAATLSFQQSGSDFKNIQTDQHVSLVTPPSSNIRAGLSIGVGYPFLSLKYYFNPAFGTEFRFSFGDGINVYAVRGYWSFMKFSDFSIVTGLETGYITFDTMNVYNTTKVEGTGYEAGPFLGGEYFLDKRLSFMIDFSMPIIGLTSRDITMGGVQWVTNGALYFYPF